MELKGNRGEWSELYTFFKLLADGCLFCGDGKLNRYDEKFYPILEVFRDDAPNRNSYKIQTAKNNILVAGETVSIEISQERFKQEAEALLERIKNTEAFKSGIESLCNKQSVRENFLLNNEKLLGQFTSRVVEKHMDIVKDLSAPEKNVVAEAAQASVKKL